MPAILADIMYNYCTNTNILLHAINF